jgi:membrane-associated phospholipid phosphatase
MIWTMLVLAIVILSFAGVLLVGAPYLPTLTPQVRLALELAGLQPGQTLLELGCGDGKVLIAAAEQGLQAVGYELNPLLVVIAWLRTRRYHGKVKVIWGNFWRQPWPPVEAIFVFLLPKYMQKLDKKVMQYSTKPVKLISCAFEIPHKPADATKKGVYLYLYK